MGKTKVTVKKGKPASGNARRPKLIGKTKARTISNLKYNTKGQRRRPGWK